MKKLLSLLLVLLMLASVLPLSAITASADTVEYPTVEMAPISKDTTFVQSEVGELVFNIHRGSYALTRINIAIFNENNEVVCDCIKEFSESDYAQDVEFTVTVDTSDMAMSAGNYLVGYKMHFYVPEKAGWYELTNAEKYENLYVVPNTCNGIHNFYYTKDPIEDYGLQLFTCYNCNHKYYKYSTGLANEASGWTYYEAGKKSDKTLFFKKNGKWLYIENGKWSAKTGLVKYNGTWFYIKNGKWDSSVNDLIKYNGVYFLIKGGKWNNTTTTLFKKNGKFFAIKNGKWFKDKALIAYSGKNFYVDKGYAQLNFTGTVKIGSKKYFISKGKESYFNPKFKVAITTPYGSKTSVIKLTITNTGTHTLRFRNTGRIVDGDAASFNRDLILVNKNMKKISYVDIKPKQKKVIYLKVKGNYTWFDSLSTIHYNFAYRGVEFRGEARPSGKVLHWPK